MMFPLERCCLKLYINNGANLAGPITPLDLDARRRRTSLGVAAYETNKEHLMPIIGYSESLFGTFSYVELMPEMIPLNPMVEVTRRHLNSGNTKQRQLLVDFLTVGIKALDELQSIKESFLTPEELESKNEIMLSDIKIDNLFLNLRNSQIVFGDYTSMRPVDSSGEITKNLAISTTREAAAPEMLAGQVCCKSDLFMLASTACEIFGLNRISRDKAREILSEMNSDTTVGFGKYMQEVYMEHVAGYREREPGLDHAVVTGKSAKRHAATYFPKLRLDTESLLTNDTVGFQLNMTSIEPLSAEEKQKLDGLVDQIVSSPIEQRPNKSAEALAVYSGLQTQEYALRAGYLLFHSTLRLYSRRTENGDFVFDSERLKSIIDGYNAKRQDLVKGSKPPRMQDIQLNPRVVQQVLYNKDDEINMISRFQLLAAKQRKEGVTEFGISMADNTARLKFAKAPVMAAALKIVLAAEIFATKADPVNSTATHSSAESSSASKPIQLIGNGLPGSQEYVNASADVPNPFQSASKRQKTTESDIDDPSCL